MYQGSEAYSLYGAERVRRQESHAPFEVVRGGGLDAQVRQGVSHTFVSRLVVAMAAVTVFVCLGFCRVALTTATVSQLQQTASLKEDIVSATAKGFAPGKGPSPGLEPGWGASHGGQGAPKSGGESGRPALVCGSIFEPAACGSGGTVADGAAPGIGHGGGAIRIEAGGDIEIYGAIRADGDGRNPGNVLLGGAAGGSIDLRAGGRFRWGGDFAVSADGGPAFRDGGGGGGGGRIALRASDEKSDIERCPWSGNNVFFNGVHAWGGTGDTRNRDSSRADVHIRAAPGTIYCEHSGGGRPAGGGSILVRGNHPPGLATTRLPSDKDGDATLQDAEVVLSWGAFCTLGASCTVRALHVRSDQAGFSLNRSVLTASEVSSGDRKHVLSESGTYRGNTDDALVPILFDGGTLVLRPYFKPAP